MRRDTLAQALQSLWWHEWACHNHPVSLWRQISLREGFSKAAPILPTPNEAQHQPARRQREICQRVAAVEFREIEPQALVEVTRVAYFCHHVGGKGIFA